MALKTILNFSIFLIIITVVILNLLIHFKYKKIEGDYSLALPRRNIDDKYSSKRIRKFYRTTENTQIKERLKKVLFLDRVESLLSILSILLVIEYVLLLIKL
jgi:hypothetical protein